MQRSAIGKPYSIVVLAEGLQTGSVNPSNFISAEIERITAIETRTTVLGYVQRGGNPSPYDRILATRLGSHAAELISKRDFNRMVCMEGQRVSSVELSKIAGKTKLVSADHDLINQGIKMGISFGI
jgi:6-phosphofructokinase 1